MGTSTHNRGTARRRRRLARRFLRSDRGVTAIEFAFVGPIFLAIIGATIETALAFFAGYALDAAVIDTSRLIRTGQSIYISSADNYRSAVCGQLYGIFDCDELRISVAQISDFGEFEMSAPIDASNGDWTLAAGQPLPAIAPLKTYMIEVFYKWPTFFNIPGINAGQTADGKRLLAATHVIRTEPFTS